MTAKPTTRQAAARAPAVSPRAGQVFSAFGPGKVILLGEHAVVYGQPALAAAISRGVRATAVPAPKASLELPRAGSPAQKLALYRAFGRAVELAGRPRVHVTLASDLPMSVGLGSSAAVAVALARVLLEAAHGAAAVVPKRVEAIALEMEREFHGTPSGVDSTTSARGGMVIFRRGRGFLIRCTQPVKVLVAIVGERAPTRATVTTLRERQGRWPVRYGRIFREIGALAREGAAAAQAGDLPQLGDLMNLNQGLLGALGLSSPAIETVVYRLRAHGALGAKLTGAGGDGGAVVGLFPEPEPIVARLRDEGLTCFTSQLGGPVTL